MIGVGDAAVFVLYHGLGQQRYPRDMVQLDLVQLSFADIDRVVSGSWYDLVRDRHDGVEAVFAGGVDVRLNLLAFQLARSRLHLDQGYPSTPSTADPHEAIGAHNPTVGHLQRHFDVGLDGPGWCTEAFAQNGLAKLAHRAEDTEQGGGCSSLAVTFSSDS